MNKCLRKFGQYQCSITKQGTISIVGDWFSNYGVIYDFNVKDYFDGNFHPLQVPQIYGMDSHYGLTKQVTAWIEKTVKRMFYMGE